MVNTRKITAQVAVEAVVNNRADYDLRDVVAVRTEAIAAGVAPFYVDMITLEPSANCAHEPNGWYCSRYTECPAFEA